MKRIVPLLLTAMLMACSNSELTETSTSSPTETVESLATNPKRLKELRQQCKIDRTRLGDELCNRVAKATNRRFLGDGRTPYTPPEESPKF